MRWLIVTVLLMLVAALLFWPFAICFAATPGERALVASERYLDVREENNDNRGPEIDRWLRFLGLPLGSPYCAAFGVYVYHEAGAELPRIGRCALLWQKVRANALRYQTLSANEVALGAPLFPGDCIIWRNGNGPDQNWNGHFGLHLERVTRTAFRSREANTQPGPEGDQREGGGVYDRWRDLGFGASFRVVGFFRVRE